jgi:hypothetical protein
MTALRTRLPGRGQLVSRAGQGVALGLTLFVLDRDPGVAATTAVLFLALTLSVDTVAVAVGDYADNAALGLLTIGLTGYLTVVGDAGLPVATAGGLVGGWLLFDGVQHLRHGERRDELSRPYSHDGSVITGLPRALAARVLEPFRL